MDTYKFSPSINNNDDLINISGAIILLGVVFRLLLWGLLFPIWKHFAAFTVFETSLINYVGNFQSYSAVRSPFYDVLALTAYLPTVDLFGVRAFTLYSVIIVVTSLPAFYIAVRGLLSERVAIFALVLYALYPKFAVLTAFGFPEASSVAYVSFSLYALNRARSSDGIAWYATAGILGTLAFLMYVPAVTVAVMLSIYVYWINRDEISSINSLLPGVPSIVYNIFPFIVGILYIIFGPIQSMLSTTSGDWTNMSSSIFTPGVNYGLVEKIIRYILYMYADFWSFGRGFDKGTGVLRKFESFQSFSGDLFPVLVFGYFLVTLILTASLLYGFVCLINHRESFSNLIVAWLVLYLTLHNLKNYGWTGTLQWRHVFPIFPAVAISFGVGADRLRSHLESLNCSTQYPVSFNVKSTTIIILLCLSPLAGVATVDAHFAGNNVELSDKQPIDRLLNTTESSADVGVARIDAYRTVVLFSGDNIRPTILVPEKSEKMNFMMERIETWTITAEHRVVRPEDISKTEIDYLYVSICGPLTPMQKAYLNSAKNNGTTIHEWEKNRGAGRCKPRGAIVRLN